MAKVVDLFSRGRRPVGDSAAPNGASSGPSGGASGIIEGFSLEVMPRTAARIDSFAEILPAGTLIYIAHIDGTPVADMVATAARIAAEGFPVMPHLPARSIPDAAALDDLLARYAGEAGVDRALLLAGGRAEPAGDFDSSLQLMETGRLDARGFTRLHVAGHPEGNRDVPGGEAALMDALRWKAAFAERTGAEMAIATQFCFELGPVLAWAKAMGAAGVGLPVHLGVAGPAKLQTLVKFAMACGVGPSVRVLTRRAADVTKLMLPFTPEAFLTELAAAKAADPSLPVERVHFFPLGGIKATAEFTDRMRAGAPALRARA